MKVPMKWIREYADIPVDAETYMNRMIMIGDGVEGYENLGAEVEGVVVGRVLTCEPHPNSDHLHVCKVDVGDVKDGEPEPLQIVCGAPNVAAGQLVPVAKNGAHLPGGVIIKKGKLRGEVSEGMICSGEELGCPPELYPNVWEKGILVFNEDYPLGADVRPILGLDDTVMDFEVLANRPDCLSVWGIARETAVALGTEFKKPEIRVVENGTGDIHDYVNVEVRDTDLCPRYVARVIDSVRVGPSPKWLREYLYGAGMRSINNVVDITNFVMLETGHPMHAFDLDKVAGRHIIVRRAKAGEAITTLDGKQHEMSEGQLAICDAEKPSCVAGVMGGEESEITEQTRSVMFECAVFDYAATRLTARALGIRTESSGRFEKGVNIRTPLEAMQRACQLIHELDAGDVVPGVIDIYPNPVPEQVVTGSCSRIARRAGVDIPAEDIVRILESLHFGVKRDGDLLTCTVPDFRQDITVGETDLCEEALRVYGYDHIPGTPLRGETTPGGRSPQMRLKDKVSGLLTGLGFCEIMNYSFVSPKAVEKLGLEADDPRLNQLPIRNPLGEDTSVMRSTLVPDMLRTLALNMNHGNETALLFEASTVFDPTNRTRENLPTETRKLCLGGYGKAVNFYTLRAVCERLLRALGVEFRVEKHQENYLHPGRSARLVSGEETVCILGEVNPDVRDRFEMNARACIAEMDLDQLLRLRTPMGVVKPMPRFPAVSRDLSLVMAEQVEIGPMLTDLREAGGKLLEDARMFDVYRNPILGPDKKSVAFSFVFRAPDRTLTEAEIGKAMDRLLKVAAEKYNAVIRA
ncbi:MAG: phenylalanine--tRNA ligase subunit beta [Clostridia bacterium]|nr:phenylalanine--tRNA ligase subunit beta [Clostridia bacterium]